MYAFYTHIVIAFQWISSRVFSAHYRITLTHSRMLRIHSYIHTYVFIHRHTHISYPGLREWKKSRRPWRTLNRCHLRQRYINDINNNKQEPCPLSELQCIKISKYSAPRLNGQRLSRHFLAVKTGWPFIRAILKSIGYLVQCSPLKRPSVKRPSRLIGQFSQIPKDQFPWRRHMS